MLHRGYRVVLGVIPLALVDSDHHPQNFGAMDRHAHVVDSMVFVSKKASGTSVAMVPYQRSSHLQQVLQQHIIAISFDSVDMEDVFIIHSSSAHDSA